MKYYKVLIFALLSNALFAQVKPTGCVVKVNVPAEYETIIDTIHFEAITYSKPITRTITKTVITKEKALEEYFECDITGRVKECSREIPSETETITYDVPTGRFELVTLFPERTTVITKKIKVRDGYIAYQPCQQ